jgi:flagellar biosynthesis/type III secretory pathway protein FliH
MSWSSKLPRAVSVDPTDARFNAERWAPDELPSGHAARHPDGMAGGNGPGGGADEAAYARGYEDGARAGEDAATARLESVVSALRAALDAVEQGTQRWIGNAEENICALAIAVARQIIAREVAADPQVVLGAVREAIAEFPIDKPISIRLNPGDLQLLISVRATDSSLAARAETRWIADPGMQPGGCVVEGHDRVIDGRVDTGLERLYHRLNNVGG